MPNNQTLTHPWDLPPTEAIALQNRLAAHVIRKTTFGTIATVAGIDASYRDGIAQAAIATLRFPDLTLLDYTIATRPIDYPYVPGLLSFREAPAVLDAFDQLTTTPDLLIFDGHGIAHPRRLGLASHIGVLLNIPAIGCAKRRLCGQYQEPGRERGNVTLLTDKIPDFFSATEHPSKPPDIGDQDTLFTKNRESDTRKSALQQKLPMFSADTAQHQEPEDNNETANTPTAESSTIGAVVRTRTGVKPVFVSIGHRVDLATAVEYILACGKGYRLPETTRWADKIAGGERPALEAERAGQQPRLL